MKRFISILLSLLYLLGIPLLAFADEITSCSIAVDSVPIPPGEQITVPVRITENQGFTNFAISLEYDPAKLSLVSINTTDGSSPYLCGSMVSTNMDWKNAENKSCGYIVSASTEALAGDGVLFTVTFQVSQDLTDYTTVTPVVHYVRNNSAVFSIFEEIRASGTAGIITAIVAGDVTGDGVVEYDDVMQIYKAYLGEAVLTEEQKILADLNGDQKIDNLDVEEIYRIYTGG
jgi:hypothetical protein